MAQRAQPVLATTDVFQKGDIHWKQFNVETSTASSSPPKPLLIFTPAVPGSYPVIFQIKFAGKVVYWLVEGFQPLLLENVKAKLEKLVLSGHSKGGKTAFAVALDHAKTNLKFSALIGIDPVAGTSKFCETHPHILTGLPRVYYSSFLAFSLDLVKLVDLCTKTQLGELLKVVIR
ncbi:hypothetical protein JHK82_017998 [Glycine max]|nr:hypothetical protein JHK82_017998 [Glycine max]